jgi:hypothetical protein
MTLLTKLTLSILFLLCLADMPYGYYELVRMVGLIGFAILAFQANQKGNQVEMIIYIGLALLFQPFFKIALGSESFRNSVECSGCHCRYWIVVIHRTESKKQNIENNSIYPNF